MAEKLPTGLHFDCLFSSYNSYGNDEELSGLGALSWKTKLKNLIKTTEKGGKGILGQWLIVALTHLDSLDLHVVIGNREDAFLLGKLVALAVEQRVHGDA